MATVYFVNFSTRKLFHVVREEIISQTGHGHQIIYLKSSLALPYSELIL
jgi:hypothetical protein